MTVKRRTNLLWGLIALAVGAFAVANALGYIPVGIVDIALRAVPALLIAVGLSFILRDRVPLSSILSLAAAGALVAAVVSSAYSARVDQVRTDKQIDIDQPIGAEIALLRIRLETNATDVELISAADGRRQVAGEFVGSAASDIERIYTIDGNAATLTLRELGTDGIPPLDALGRGALRVELPPSLPLDIDFIGDDGAVTFNLSGVSLERLNLTAARGNVVVTLPDYAPQLSQRGESLGAITVGGGDLTLFVPASVAGRFELNRGGSGIEPVYDANAYRYLVGDVLEARGIDTAAAVVRYALNVGRGQIRIQTPG
jgi:hypothetical protein